MMNLLKNKIVLTIIAVVVLGLIAYAYLSSEGAPQSSDLVVSSSDNGIVGADILSSLNEVNSLTLDTQIFTDIDSLQLQDFSQDLPQNVPVGRENPFQPINFAKSGSTGVLPGGPQTFATSTAAAPSAPKAIPSSSGN